jgi:hypothetical protein
MEFAAGHLPADWTQWGGHKTTAAKLQALMGNDPRVRQSGQWEGCARMSKRGIEPLRTAMFQAVFCGMIHDAGLRAYYEHKRAAGEPHKVALSHLMRILTRRLVAVLKTGKQPIKGGELVLGAVTKHNSGSWMHRRIVKCRDPAPGR